MFAAIFDFALGWLVTSSAVNTRRTARNTAIAAERSAWTDAQKLAYQKRQTYLRGEKRFILIVLAVLLGGLWVLGKLIGN